MNGKKVVVGNIGFLLGAVVTFAFTTAFNRPYTNYGMMGTNGGMMGTTTITPSAQQVAQIKQEEQEGQNLLKQVQAGKLTCATLTPDNFEKIGDYVMRQRVGSSEKHAVMDANMTQMMGDAQNTQMHIALGENAAGCSNTPGTATSSGMMHMMGY